MRLEKRIQIALQQKGINQRQLAVLLNCSETTVSKWLNKPQNFRLSTIKKLEKVLNTKLMETTENPFPNSIFSDYVPHKYSFSKSLFWEYDKESFNPAEHKKTVVSRVAERGRLNDYFAAFDACGGMDGFKETYMNLKKVNRYSKNFICLALNINPKELSCSI